MGGVIVPVDVKVEQSGDDFSLHLVNGGQDFETEQYKNPPDGFLLVNAAGETYAPPIPLLKFPMRIGDTWKWSGDMITGPASRKADAAIRTRDDKVDMGTPVDALLVEVDLSMYSGASQPATRRLAFWFVKGKGLVKREFGSSTSRVPNEAKTE
ncbi:MAG: hypothetical protein QOJ65_2459 [Fimbriimonadaceae bacterium]|nr:hypothetical protein [Fimbriimonadaceae bacterium]